MNGDALLVFGNEKMLSRYSGIRPRAEARGLQVFAIKHGDASSAAIAITGDSIISLDLSTATNALAGVLAVTAGRRIVGGICLDEAHIPVTATVLSALGLPGPGLYAATVSVNKFLQRVACPAHSPQWRLVTPTNQGDIGDIPLPCVIKPVGRHSSSGVVLAHSEAELAALLTGGTYGNHESVLVEERVAGQEYSVESLVSAGQVLHAGPTRKATTRPPYFVEVSHTVPAAGLSDQEQAALLAANAEVVSSIGVETAFTHAEYRITAEGRVVLMEIAVRPPGDAISLLYQAAYGVTFDEQLLALALGETPPVGTATRTAAQHYLLPQEEGTFTGVTLEKDGFPGPDPELVETHLGVPWPELQQFEASAGPAVRVVLVHKTPGDRLGAVRESADRPASIMVDTPLKADPDAFAESVLPTVRLECR